MPATDLSWFLETFKNYRLVQDSIPIKDFNLFCEMLRTTRERWGKPVGALSRPLIASDMSLGPGCVTKGVMSS